MDSSASLMHYDPSDLRSLIQITPKERILSLLDSSKGAEVTGLLPIVLTMRDHNIFQTKDACESCGLRTSVLTQISKPEHPVRNKLPRSLDLSLSQKNNDAKSNDFLTVLRTF